MGSRWLWDTGTWSPEPGFRKRLAAAKKANSNSALDAVKLKGSWVLVRTGPGTATGEREHWLLIKHRDESAGDLDIATAAPKSINPAEPLRTNPA